eukprot:m.67915 g.67915  ORF g.67915 m.67915 type:complete len:119 (-) comp9889_c0_seq1:155-511(-)
MSACVNKSTCSTFLRLANGDLASQTVWSFTLDRTETTRRMPLRTQAEYLDAAHSTSTTVSTVSSTRTLLMYRYTFRWVGQWSRATSSRHPTHRNGSRWWNATRCDAFGAICQRGADFR